MSISSRLLKQACAELTQILKVALLRIIDLCALDDDCVRRQVDTPGQRGSCAEDLQVFESSEAYASHNSVIHRNRTSQAGESMSQTFLHVGRLAVCKLRHLR